MKVGDKLLCKKEHKFFRKGKNYTIINIEDWMEYGFNIIEIKDTNSGSSSGLRTDTQLFECFYTEKEIRKLKLDKISEI